MLKIGYLWTVVQMNNYQEKMERDCCEFICSVPTTFQCSGIEWYRIDQYDKSTIDNTINQQLPVLPINNANKHWYKYNIHIDKFYILYIYRKGPKQA